MTVDVHSQLTAFRAQHAHLVCIDSDGCVFDTMGIKQRECFCPWMIAYFNLQPVAQAARACKEFADLFSKTRGANRHVTIKRILTELLPTHPLVKRRGFEVPVFPNYFAWVDDPESLLSNEGLRAAIESANDHQAKQELTHVLAWSERVNWAVEEIVRDVPPFPYVQESLERLEGVADVVVVSATPLEALEREWVALGIDRWVSLICGQEMGTKKEHIEALTNQYGPERVLMIGDAPGDLRAAKANGALFLPVVPGEEEGSWERLHREGLDLFLRGEFAGRYEDELIAVFDKALPERPPWEVGE